jgi:hypothetical protein
MGIPAVKAAVDEPWLLLKSKNAVIEFSPPVIMDIICSKPTGVESNFRGHPG